MGTSSHSCDSKQNLSPKRAAFWHSTGIVTILPKEFVQERTEGNQKQRQEKKLIPQLLIIIESHFLS